LIQNNGFLSAEISVEISVICVPFFFSRKLKKNAPVCVYNAE